MIIIIIIIKITITIIIMIMITIIIIMIIIIRKCSPENQNDDRWLQEGRDIHVRRS